jgi:hypothetical protein
MMLRFKYAGVEGPTFRWQILGHNPFKTRSTSTVPYACMEEENIYAPNFRFLC